MKVFDYTGYIYIIISLKNYLKNYNFTLFFINTTDSNQLIQLSFKKENKVYIQILQKLFNYINKYKIIYVKNLKIIYKNEQVFSCIGLNEKFYKIKKEYNKVKEYFSTNL